LRRGTICRQGTKAPKKTRKENQGKWSRGKKRKQEKGWERETEKTTGRPDAAEERKGREREAKQEWQSKAA
jgi:hypothetical protein